MSESTPASGNGKPLVLLPDLPNWNVDEGTFGPYADVLSDAIRGTPPPFTLGIFGDYGSGKTTLMRMIQKRLDGSENTPTVWFNAWRFQREDHLILPLLETIRLEMLTRKGTWQKVGANLGRVTGALIGGITAGLTVGGASWDPNKAIDAAQKMSEDVGGQSLYFDSLRYLDEVMKKMRSEDPSLRVVVFIDDMDRCLPSKGLELLEGVKTFLDVDGFVFVLGLDRQVVEEFVLREKYKWMPEESRRRLGGPAPYVAKIVQVPFDLPPLAAEEVQRYAAGLLTQEEDGESPIRHLAEAVVAGVPHNRRYIKRLVNAYRLRMAIQERTGHRLDPVVTLILLAINLRWVSFYRELASRHKALLDEVAQYVEGRGEGRGDGQEREKSPHPLLEEDQALRDFLAPDGPAASLYRLDEDELMLHLHVATGVGVEVAREELDAPRASRARRAQSLERLSMGDRSEALPQLLRELATGSPDSQRTAASQLGERAVDWDLGPELAGDAEVIRQLCDHLTDEITSPSRGGLALLLLDAGSPPENQILEALPHAFYYPGSSAAERAEAKLRELVSADETRDMTRAALVAGLENVSWNVRGMSAVLLVDSVESGELPEAPHLEAMVSAFYFGGSAAGHAEAKFRELLSGDETRDMARAALVAGLESDSRNTRGMSGLLLVDSVESGGLPEARHLEALVNALYSPGSPAAGRVEAKFRELMSDDETREMAHAALAAGLENDDGHVRGMSALLLVESVRSGELPEAQHLEAMVSAFYRPDSAAAGRAEAKFRELLSADETRDMARAALVAGSESESRNIRSACRELLEEAGLLEPTQPTG